MAAARAVPGLLGPALPRHSPASPADLPALLAGPAEIRHADLACGQETNGIGLRAVAVSIQRPAVRDWTHAVSVVVPTARFQDQVPRLEELFWRSGPPSWRGGTATCHDARRRRAGGTPLPARMVLLTVMRGFFP